MTAGTLDTQVVETAPAIGLPDELTKTLYDDAVRITAGAGYVNAGTVEFLVDPQTWEHYFIEVNPRIQVEHTVTEVITGVDLVQSQIRIAAGQRLSEIGLTQPTLSKRGFAIQARVTTEDPSNGFRPDTGRLQVRDRGFLLISARFTYDGGHLSAAGLEARRGVRDPPRRRECLPGRHHNASLRLDADEGHGLLAHLPIGGRQARPRAGRDPHPRRAHQLAIHPQRAPPPSLPRGAGDYN